MAKVKNPLMSISASGSIAENLTFSIKKTGQQVRWQKKQKDVESYARNVQRSAYSKAVVAWRVLDQVEKNSWKTLAGCSPLTGYNLFVREHIAGNITNDSFAFFGSGIFGVCILGNT